MILNYLSSESPPWFSSLCWINCFRSSSQTNLSVSSLALDWAWAPTLVQLEGQGCSSAHPWASCPSRPSSPSRSSPAAPHTARPSPTCTHAMSTKCANIFTKHTKCASHTMSFLLPQTCAISNPKQGGLFLLDVDVLVQQWLITASLQWFNRNINWLIIFILFISVIFCCDHI